MALKRRRLDPEHFHPKPHTCHKRAPSLAVASRVVECGDEPEVGAFVVPITFRDTQAIARARLAFRLRPHGVAGFGSRVISFSVVAPLRSCARRSRDSSRAHTPEGDGRDAQTDDSNESCRPRIVSLHSWPVKKDFVTA